MKITIGQLKNVIKEQISESVNPWSQAAAAAKATGLRGNSLGVKKLSAWQKTTGTSFANLAWKFNLQSDQGIARVPGERLMLRPRSSKDVQRKESANRMIGLSQRQVLPSFQNLQNRNLSCRGHLRFR